MSTVVMAGENGDVTATLEGELTGLGCTVFTADNGRDALELAVRYQPDMVFLCETMPVYGGYETCSLMRQNPDLPRTLPIILVLSGPANPRIVERCGATTFLPARHPAWELQELVARYQ